MRWDRLILTLLFVGGCAAHHPAPAPETEAEALSAESESWLLADASPALVFSPVDPNLSQFLDLSREGRGESAYWGLQGPITTFFYQRTDDRYGDFGWGGGAGGNDGIYQRRTVETRMSTSIR